MSRFLGSIHNCRQLIPSYQCHLLKTFRHSPNFPNPIISSFPRLTSPPLTTISFPTSRFYSLSTSNSNPFTVNPTAINSLDVDLECVLTNLSGSDSGIRNMILNRPKSKNALGKTFMTQFQLALETLRFDELSCSTSMFSFYFLAYWIIIQSKSVLKSQDPAKSNFKLSLLFLSPPFISPFRIE